MFSEIAAIAREYGCVFTLYVDDMTFSSSKPIQVNNLIRKNPQIIEQKINKYLPFITTLPKNSYIQIE